MLKSKKGVTLIELTIVLSILAVLSSIIVPLTFGSIIKAKKAADNANLHALNSAVRVQSMIDRMSSPALYSIVRQALDNANINEIPEVLHDSSKAFLWDDSKKTFYIGDPPGDPLTCLVGPVHQGEPEIPPVVGEDEWDPEKMYQSGERVKHNNALFVAKCANQGNEPGQTTAWQEVTNEWRWFNTYYTGDIVTHGNHRYRARRENENYEPFPNSKGPWEKIEH